MIEEQKHTLGEWGYDRAPQDYDGGGSPAYSTITCGDVVIAQVNDLIPEGAANGHLMAAAPDMLAALEAIISASDSDNAKGGEMWWAEAVYPHVEAAKSVISKAKGAQ